MFSKNESSHDTFNLRAPDFGLNMQDKLSFMNCGSAFEDIGQQNELDEPEKQIKKYLTE